MKHTNRSPGEGLEDFPLWHGHLRMFYSSSLVFNFVSEIFSYSMWALNIHDKGTFILRKEIV